MAGNEKGAGVVILLLGIAWLLGQLNVITADVMRWLLIAIAVLGGLYLVFMEK